MPNCARLIFLRGYPTPEWLKSLGSQFRIDPEFFRRHMAIFERQDFFDVPALPSFTRNIIQLKITTLFTRQIVITQPAVLQGRRDSIEAVRRHQIELEKRDEVGNSIVRRLSIHNETTYSLEQDISCCIVKKHGGWAGEHFQYL